MSCIAARGVVVFKIFYICTYTERHTQALYSMNEMECVHIRNIICIYIMYSMQESKACHASPPEVSLFSLCFMYIYIQNRET